jgi:Terminase RNaseH-like domain
MPQTLRLSRAGDVQSAPKSASYRVVIEGAPEPSYAISPEGFRTIAADREQRRIFIESALSFISFLDVWTFIPPGQDPMLLGPNMWEAQSIYADATTEHDSLYFLKARQLGESTVAVAFDAWRLRFGPTNCRVSILAQNDGNSKTFLADAVYGLEHLPPALRLPVRALEHSATLTAGENDSRIIRSYPATNAIRSGSFNHFHLDEWAFHLDAAKTWRATEEAIVPGGTVHVLTTGIGGADYTAEEWRRARDGASRFHPLFLHALLRPDRTPDWYEEKKRTTDLQTLRQELPMTEEDALAGHGEFRFSAEALDHCGSALRIGFQSFQHGRRYLIAVDPGEKDGTAICVIDATRDQHIGSARAAVYVANFRLLRPTTLLEAQYAIEQMALAYPTAPVVIETNGVGLGVFRNCRVSSSRKYERFTTPKVKRGMVSDLALLVQAKQIAWDATVAPDLDKEMRGYKEEDANIKQDCVMALALAIDNLDLAIESSAGRLGNIVYV